MYYIGISVNLSDIPMKMLNNTDLKYEQGLIYARKGNTTKDLIMQKHELETIKGKIRRLPSSIYDFLNDDFGLHVRR
jgi:hypothetical protein